MKNNSYLYSIILIFTCFSNIKAEINDINAQNQITTKGLKWEFIPDKKNKLIWERSNNIKKNQDNFSKKQ
tara:strand:+ start:150 stop:359 length:210 start_codon:yes stop_codon:yes gene_type:complete